MKNGDTVLLNFPLFCPKCSTAKNDVKQRARRIMRKDCFLWYGNAGSLSCYVSVPISMAPFALGTDKTDSMIGIREADSCSLHSSIINRSWRIAGLSLFISGLKISLESSLSARTKGYRTSILGRGRGDQSGGREDCEEG